VNLLSKIYELIMGIFETLCCVPAEEFRAYALASMKYDIER